MQYGFIIINTLIDLNSFVYVKSIKDSINDDGAQTDIQRPVGADSFILDEAQVKPIRMTHRGSQIKYQTHVANDYQNKTGN